MSSNSKLRSYPIYFIIYFPFIKAYPQAGEHFDIRRRVTRKRANLFTSVEEPTRKRVSLLMSVGESTRKRASRLTPVGEPTRKRVSMFYWFLFLKLSMGFMFAAFQL